MRTPRSAPDANGSRRAARPGDAWPTRPRGNPSAIAGQQEPGSHLIGTSGWVYGSWKGTVYPEGVRQADWLAHFATRFPTVEVNATFYRLPRRSMVEGWAQRTPPSFRFAVKGSRYLTHLKRLQDVDAGLKRFLDAVAPLGERMTAILWQLPPTLTIDLDLLARFLDALPPTPQPAVEFRHRSWQTSEAYELLDAHGAMTVAVSGPQLPAARIVTGGRAYVRFHGLTGGYAHDYTGHELAVWGRFVAECDAALVYFNNDAGGAAVRNAEHFTEMVARRLGGTDRKLAS